MNKVFKILWNQSLQAFVVVSELARGAKNNTTVRSVPVTIIKNEIKTKKTALTLAVLLGITLLNTASLSYAQTMDVNLTDPKDLDESDEFIKPNKLDFNINDAPPTVLTMENDQDIVPFATGDQTHDLANGSIELDARNNSTDNTIVTGGAGTNNVLNINVDQALSSGNLKIATGNVVNLNGQAQEVMSLDIILANHLPDNDYKNGTLDLGGGHLTITGTYTGGVSAPGTTLYTHIVGKGKISLLSDRLSLQEGYNQLDAELDIAQGAALIVYSYGEKEFTSAGMNINGKVEIHTDKNYSFNQKVIGGRTGSLSFQSKTSGGVNPQSVEFVSGLFNGYSGTVLFYNINTNLQPDIFDNKVSVTISDSSNVSINGSYSLNMLRLTGGVLDLGASSKINLAGGFVSRVTQFGNSNYPDNIINLISNKSILDNASLVLESEKPHGWIPIFTNGSVDMDESTTVININGQKYDKNNATYSEEYFQNSDQVADLIFTYKLDFSKGITVNSNLTGVDILRGKVLTISDVGNSGAFNLSLTGAGGLALGIGDGQTLTFNKTNTYAGHTTIQNGTIVAGANSIFGTLGDLTINSGATVKFGNYNQTVGSLSGAGNIEFGTGTLTITKGGTIDATINGGGNLVLDIGDGQTSTLNQKNGYTGGTIVKSGTISTGSDNAFGAGDLTINSGATVKFGNYNQTVGLLSGAGNIELGIGTLTITKGGVIDATINGGGNLVLDIGNGQTSTLNKTNGYVGVTTVKNGTISSGADNAFGTGDLIINTGAIVDLANHNQVLGALSGAGNMNFGTGTLTITKGSTIATTLSGSGKLIFQDAQSTLTNSNSNLSAEINITGTSVITTDAVNALGTGSITIADTARLVLNQRVDNTLMGSGSIIVNSNFSLSNTQISAFTGNIIVDSNTLSITDKTELNTATFTINDGARLSLIASGKKDYEFNQSLKGDGVFGVDLSGGTLSLGANANVDFSGMLNLTNTTFYLSDLNNQGVAKNISLTLGTNAQVYVAPIKMGDLVLTGGKVIFSDSSVLNVSGLNLSEGGQIDLVDIGNVDGDIVSGTNLINQSNKKVNIDVIVSDTKVQGDLSDITLTFDGEIVDLSTGITAISDYLVNSETVAKLTYAYQWVTEQNGTYGLYGNYGLTNIEVLSGKNLELASTSTDHTLDSSISGSGNLVLSGTADTALTLNKSSSYTGNTTITSGEVILGAEDGFGQTAMLQIDAGATANLNGQVQTIGALENSGTVVLGDGELTIVNGGTAGTLSGNGTINLSNGELIVSNKNDALTTITNVTSNAILTLKEFGTFGTGLINLAGRLNITNDITLVNQLAGDGIVNADALTQFSADNSDFKGSYVIGENGELTVNKATQIGSTSSIAIMGGLILEGVRDSLGQQLSGTGSVNLTDSTIQFTNINSAYTGDYTLKNSTLTVEQKSEIGSGNIVLEGSDNTVIFSNYKDTLDNAISGAGLLSLDNTEIDSVGKNLKDFTGNIELSASDLSIEDNNEIQESVGFNLDNGSTLQWSSNGALTLNNLVQGSGTLAVNANKNTVTLGQGFGTDFKGTLGLSNSTFVFDQGNSNQLTDATFLAGKGSVVQVEHDNTVGNLVLETGSRIQFDGHATGERAENVLNVTGEISLKGGEVAFTNIGDDVGNTPGDNSESLLDQMNTDQGILLVSGKVTGTTSNMSLSIDGKIIGEKDSIDVNLSNLGSQGVAAVGKYNYGLVTTSGGQSGLYLHYGLVGIDLQKDAGNALLLVSDAKGSNLNAELFGEGGLRLDATQQDMIISNMNSYKGETILYGGNITLTVNNALGNTSSLNIEAGSINLGAQTQTVGAINNNGKLTIADGTLTITGGGNLNSIGSLSGKGNIKLTGGTLNANNSNDDLSANISIADKASVDLTSAASNLGTGEIALAGQLNISADNVSVVNKISGQGTVDVNGNTTLTGNNTNFSGIFKIAANKSLNVDKTFQLGFGSTLNLAGNLNVTSTQDDDLSQTIIGNGNINIEDSTLEMSGDQQEFSGQYNLTESFVTVGDKKSLGSGEINLSNSSMTLNYDMNNFDNVMTGNGNLVFTQGNIILGNDVLGTAVDGYTGTLTINDKTTVNINAATQLGDTLFNLNGKNSVLAGTSDGHHHFESALTGQGRLHIDLTHSSNVFTFDSSKSDSFTGTVHLANASFALDTAATDALDQVTLGIGKGAKVTVTDGLHELAGVEGDGGNIYFTAINDTDPDATHNLIAEGKIKVNSLDITSNGLNVYINLPGELEPGYNEDGSDSLLDYDEGKIQLQLAQTDRDSVEGAIGNIKVFDGDGNILDSGDDHIIDFNNGTFGTFGFKAVTGDENDGLYLSYGMTVLTVSDGHSAIISNPNNSNTDFSSQITGAGGITVDMPDQILLLSNSSNDYKGATEIISGGVRLDANHALGDTSLLTVKQNTFFDLNGNMQTLADLTVDKDGQLHMNGADTNNSDGELTITGVGTVVGEFTGRGTVILAEDATLDLSHANTRLATTIQMNAGTNLRLQNIAAAGMSQIEFLDDQATVQYMGVTGQLSNEWIGNGNVVFANNDEGDHSKAYLSTKNDLFTGTFVVNENNQLTATDVEQIEGASVSNQGTFELLINTNQTLVDNIQGIGTFIKNGLAELTLDEHWDYQGLIEIAAGSLALTENAILGSDNNLGVVIKDQGNLNGLGLVKGGIENHGIIQVGSLDDPKKRTAMGTGKLTIDGDVMNHHTINIMAANGESVGNELVINGNYTGVDNAEIYMNAVLGGNTNSVLDQLIINGHADGESKVFVNDLRQLGEETDEQGLLLITTQSSENNAFTLGNTVMSGGHEYLLKRNAESQDWYLSSYVGTDQLVRPDVGNNISNVITSVQSIIPGFNDNRGMRSLSQFHGSEMGSEQRKTSIWNTTGASKSKGRVSGQVHYDSDYYSSIFGGDHILSVGNSLVQLGVMIGTMEAKSHSRNTISGSSGKSKVTGQMYGIYGSWYIDVEDAFSPYVDGSVMYGSYRNKLKTKGNADITYRSHAWSYTLQGGYPIDIGENLILEPQAQMTYIDYSADSYRDNGGTRISQSLKGDIVGRMGAFIYPKHGDVRPYAGMNFWYDNTQAQVWMDQDRMKSDKAGFMMEVRAGVNAELNKDFSLSVDANYRQGKHKNKNYSVGLTLQYKF